MWKIAKMNDLTFEEIHALYKLRTDVFVVEQNCPYPEVDDDDLSCLHGLFLNKTNQLKAYFRVIEKPKYSKIGRVVVASDARGTGLGRELVLTAIAQISEDTNIYIEAQAHLEKFYQSCGFTKVTDTFLEDGIPHIGMEIKRH